MVRAPAFALVTLGLIGCGGASATVEGTAGGISWGESTWAYAGARYIVISAVELECRDVSWVETSYDEGVAPADFDLSVLQFAFPSAESIAEGRSAVSQGGQAEATIVNVSGNVFHEYEATGGTLDVDSVEQDSSAAGSFESVTFEDGTLSGSFTAEWCVNLKP